MEDGFVKFTVGRLVCGRFRDFLEQAKFAGYEIEYHETGGWIQHDFIVRGKQAHIDQINHTLYLLAQQRQ